MGSESVWGRMDGGKEVSARCASGGGGCGMCKQRQTRLALTASLFVCVCCCHTLCLSAATINFSRLGARAFISKTAKSSAKVYFKSTMTGLHPDDQAAGQRLPSFKPAAAGAGPSARAGRSGTQAAAVGVPAVSGGQGPATYGGQPSPYPAGSSAAAAAARPAYS